MMLTVDQVFCKKSKADRATVTRWILKLAVHDYKCAICELKDAWNGMKLTLHLEHKNGIGDDNRWDNLEFLCPNCHSQTETYCTRIDHR